MKIVFASVALNIHQVGVADELYRLCGNDYRFIETGLNVREHAKGGTDNSFALRPYLIRLSDGQVAMDEAMRLIREADVYVHGASPLCLLENRVKTGKLTFVCGERWLKKGLLNLLSPRLIRQQWLYHIYCRKKPVYALCSSAYAAADYRLLHSYCDKCYKWGYFTAVPELDINNVIVAKRNASTVKILWVARFLLLKHPERMLQLASQLRREALDFQIDMIGAGPEYEKTYAQVQKQGLGDYVKLLGAIPNDEVLEAMRSHHISCFTSDKNEGWGAVLNEAMANGCCPVSSIETGSTPYLIKDGINGFSFSQRNENELFEKVKWLILHPTERERMSVEAYRTMCDVWSPKNAAANLLRLCGSLLDGGENTIADGPCGKAE